MLKRTYKHTYIDEDKDTHIHTRINANRHTYTLGKWAIMIVNTCRHRM